VRLLDLSYLEDVLDHAAALQLLEEQLPSRTDRESILISGYPGYDTSVGWYQYDAAQIEEKVKQSLDNGFGAFKLKVGGSLDHDLSRAHGLRKIAGDKATIMFDANQQWNLPQALTACKELGALIQPGGRSIRSPWF
jgi:L-fuconate dehydratase